MRAVLAAVAFLLAVPSVAGAAVTPGDYGGGAFQPPIKPRFVGHGSSLVFARVAPDLRVRIAGRVALACGSMLFDWQMTPAADGSFRFTSRFKSPVEGSRSRATVTGRFDGAAASGTVRGRVWVKQRGKVRTCRTRGAQTWQLRLPAPAGAPSPPHAGASYFGVTSQPGKHMPYPFLLRVADDGARIVQAKFEYERRCRRRSFAAIDLMPPATIAPDGTFHSRERYAIPTKGGIVERYRVRVDGQFTATGVSGSVRVTTTATRHGRRFDRCDTGPLTFAASV